MRSLGMRRNFFRLKQESKARAKLNFYYENSSDLILQNYILYLCHFVRQILLARRLFTFRLSVFAEIEQKESPKIEIKLDKGIQFYFFSTFEIILLT